MENINYEFTNEQTNEAFSEYMLMHLEINELLEINKKLNEILNQANSMIANPHSKLLVSDLEDAKKRILILIGESTKSLTKELKKEQNE